MEVIMIVQGLDRFGEFRAGDATGHDKNAGSA
jgi:hypothetical protein